VPKISYGLSGQDQRESVRSSPKRLAKAGAAVVGMAAVMTAAGAAFTAAPAAAKAGGLSPDQGTRVFAHYKSKGCKVYPNDPRMTGHAQPHTWKIAKNKPVAWRYNVAGGWAVVQDPGRAMKEKGTRDKPWWGYVPRECIGGTVGNQKYFKDKGEPVPKTVNRARLPVAGPKQWEWVYLDPAARKPPPGSAPAARGVKVKANSTLRGASDIVVGNVFKSSKVNVYNDVYKNHWVKVCQTADPKNCGYIQASKLNKKQLPGSIARLG